MAWRRGEVWCPSRRLRGLEVSFLEGGGERNQLLLIDMLDDVNSLILLGLICSVSASGPAMSWRRVQAFHQTL